MDMIARRGLSRRHGAVLLLLALVLLLLATRGSARDSTAFDLADHPVTPGLSVMTYNVEGLPWPVRFGRQEALRQIGTRLAAMRAAGSQPHIVLLQEAFSDDARAIGAAAGYAHAAFGPTSDHVGAAATRADDRRFEAEGSILKGERVGKLLDSGLTILSDYPIRSVKSAPFPAFACAGYDCLANKGMVMAIVDLPGGPAAIVNLHLNSKKASGVDRPRADAAFQRQVDAADAFLTANLPADMPAIVGGDFNIGKSVERKAMVMAMLARHAGGTPLDALTGCAATCRRNLPADAAWAQQRAKDWQFLLPAARSEIAVRRITAPFGRERDGSMLSDHIGYTAFLDIAQTGKRQPSPRG